MAKSIDHSSPRRDDDGRKRVAELILSGKYPPDSSDRVFERDAGCSKYLVRSVREELTRAGKLAGPAAAGPHRYKSGAVLRGGYKHDGKGGVRQIAKPNGKRKPAVKPMKAERVVRISTDGTIEMAVVDYLDWLREQLGSVEEWIG